MFTIKMEQPVTVGGVTRCGFTVELSKVDYRSAASQEKPAQSPTPSAKTKIAEK